MNIILAAVDAPLEEAWMRFCGDLPDVTIHRGSILDVRCDAVVSPANSFGFMDGGIDMIYSQHFGWGVQERLQEIIRTRHHGELLVGAAEIVETGDVRIPFVIAAPTMRVPMELQYSVNPYLACRAVLLLIKHRTFQEGMFAGEAIADIVKTVAIPGLGTGIGRVSPDSCAWQVRAAIEAVCLGKEEFPTSWSDAHWRHHRLYGDQGGPMG
jgi:O-acetyl-ADP-ribose deacetylase (regulator of RNase III)